MLIVSNNLVGNMPIDRNATLRINLAWIKDIQEAKKILDNSSHYIYLDYPMGRTKPPKPTIKLEEALKLTSHHKVKYFAISNSEDPKYLENILNKIGNTILVPKVETEKGIKNIQGMIDIGIKYIMLDKEDLYVDIGCDSDKFNELVDEARSYKNINVLELKGVVFI